ncbi:hypothetical protein K1719_008746 [Acacia pycnantha]|nr:hypothetical protein K1719_008746 [Acacia pycnantha]
MSTSDRPSDSYDKPTAPSSDSSFDLQNSLDKLEEQKRKLGESETKVEEVKRTLGRGIPKIQKVQPYLRNRKDFADAQYYAPKLVSIGPIHGADKDSREKLKGGERYKMIWAAMYLEHTNQNAQLLFGKIRNELPALMELYAEEVIEGFRGNNKEEELAWTFLLDGCAVLEFIRNQGIEKPKAKLKIKVDQLVLVQQDMLFLENQLPYRLLTLLSNGHENELNQWIKSFLKTHPMITSTIAGTGSSNGSEEVNITVEVDQPPHLLHLLRQSILGDPGTKINKDGGESDWAKREIQTYRNIQELKEAGIAVTKWNVEKNKRLTDIGFEYWGISLRRGGIIGKLELMPLTVDDLMLPTFLNLIAYEMCPDFENGYEISSYVAFMDSLIDHPDDVKQLRKAGILHNVLGSDEDVAKVFNIISTDLMPDIERYRKVRERLNDRYTTRCLTWLAQVTHDHFSNPWSFLGFVATIVALLLTFVQTWYTIYAPPSNDTHPPPPHHT